MNPDEKCFYVDTNETDILDNIKKLTCTGSPVVISNLDLTKLSTAANLGTDQTFKIAILIDISTSAANIAAGDIDVSIEC